MLELVYVYFTDLRFFIKVNLILGGVYILWRCFDVMSKWGEN